MPLPVPTINRCQCPLLFLDSGLKDHVVLPRLFVPIRTLMHSAIQHFVITCVTFSIFLFWVDEGWGGFILDIGGISVITHKVK